MKLLHKPIRQLCHVQPLKMERLCTRACVTSDHALTFDRHIDAVGCPQRQFLLCRSNSAILLLLTPVQPSRICLLVFS
eukprot:4468353-Pleurochrysis_carterae.AAC.1